MLCKKFSTGVSSIRLLAGGGLLMLFFLCGTSALQAQSSFFSGAGWISPGFAEDSVLRPCPVFLKSFVVSRKLKKATLYVTALGIYEAELNGRKVGKAWFAPGFTSYDRRLEFQQYEVTALVKTGNNQISVTVADGWYRGIFGGRMQRNNYGKDAGLLLKLKVVYADGDSLEVVSDDSWKSTTGHTRYADFYQGELQDTRLIGVQGFGLPVRVLPEQGAALIKGTAAPVTAHEQLKPLRIFKTPNGEEIVDFGQNMAGVVSLKVKESAGDTLRIQHAEMLDSAGNFWTGNLREAKAEDVYVLNGKLQVLMPRFTYHGFRYAKITGAKATFSNCRAIALYSNLKQTGIFSCSDPRLNRLQQNILWSMKSNFVDIPTDCPQRSERLGWTGDAQVFCRTAGLNYDVLQFYRKYLADLAADQGGNGGLPNIIPDVYGHRNTGAKRGVAGWGDAATIIPTTLYELYGDTAVLQRQYASMKGWVDYISSQTKDDLWKARGYGDWYAMGDSTSLHLIDQAFYVHSAELLVKAAGILGKHSDVAAYRGLADRSKSAFMAAYGKFDSRATQTQTAYLLALAFDLLPEESRQKTAALLAEKIRANGNKLATGFLGTPHLLPVLSRFGCSDLAYELLLQEGCPSWLYPITKGATTIWERWDAVRPDGSIQETSFNHFSYGAVGQWFYEHIAGIQAAEPGYRKIRIKPEIGGGLTWAKAAYDCPYGRIVSEWKLVNGKIKMKVEIPTGTSATVFVPGKDSVVVGAGKHEFTGTVLNDGPYVFYKNGLAQVMRIKNGKLKTSSGTRSFAVRFDHSHANFDVVIKKEIRPEPSAFDQPEKIFAVSDVEGEFHAFRELLIGNKIIDGSYNWTFGKGHLVICGDLFDRDLQVTELLWLLYALEGKAAAAGGYVHVILGNHDIMNLSGDFRYVERKYFDAAKILGMSYREVFNSGTELGRWLRSKNVMEKIGDRLFVHGGVSAEVLKSGLDLVGINQLCKPFYGADKKDLSDAVQVFFGKNSPFWYRGYFMSPRADESLIDQTLKFFGVRQVVVGHTILQRNIASYYHGKVVGLDVDMHQGEKAAVIFDGDRAFVVNADGDRRPLVYLEKNDEIRDEDIR